MKGLSLLVALSICLAAVVVFAENPVFNVPNMDGILNDVKGVASALDKHNSLSGVHDVAVYGYAAHNGKFLCTHEFVDEDAIKVTAAKIHDKLVSKGCNDVKLYQVDSQGRTLEVK